MIYFLVKNRQFIGQVVAFLLVATVVFALLYNLLFTDNEGPSVSDPGRH